MSTRRTWETAEETLLSTELSRLLPRPRDRRGGFEAWWASKWGGFASYVPPGEALSSFGICLMRRRATAWDCMAAASVQHIGHRPGIDQYPSTTEGEATTQRLFKLPTWSDLLARQDGIAAIGAGGLADYRYWRQMRNSALAVLYSRRSSRYSVHVPVNQGLVWPIKQRRVHVCSSAFECPQDIPEGHSAWVPADPCWGRLIGVSPDSNN
ncbi:hypothetical protein GGR56DRAFT_304166 [Xylariaceae sp. FL0804]|nr:hypothetical protein GGR56DRAFT_304166 [Xylariaceae sp. FL0804]